MLAEVHACSETFPFIMCTKAITATTSLVIAVFAVVFGPLVAAIVAVAIHTAMHTDITKKCNVN